MKTIKLLLLLGLFSSANAELRTWTLTDGRTVDAELSGHDRPGLVNVKLVDPDGKTISIPMDQFAPADQEYIDIARVPEMDIDLLRKLPQKHFSSKVAERAIEYRHPEIRASFGVRVKQTGSGSYTHDLHAEIFAIGRQIYADRYMVLSRESIRFNLTKENGRRFEYMSDKWVPIRDYPLGEFAQRGEKYHGYLILVMNQLGNIVAHEESPDWLFDYKDNMLKLRPGNYFDNHCVRCSPIRPDPVVDLSF